MNPEELAVLLTTLRKFNVESYAYKELAITFRFPKQQQEAQACIVVNPQEQVEDFESASEDSDEDDDPEDVAAVDVNPVPLAFRHLFKAVPKKSGKVA